MPLLLFADGDLDIWWYLGLGLAGLIILVLGYKLLQQILVEPHSGITAEDVPGRAKLEQLIGKVGKTLTPLAPAGMVLLAGRRTYATTGGTFVEFGQWVQVTKVVGIIVYVRPLGAEETDLLTEE